MDGIGRFSFNRWVKNIREKAFALSKTNSSSSAAPSLSPILKAALLLIIGGGILVLAHQTSQTDGANAFAEGHWPPKTTFEESLIHRGYVAVRIEPYADLLRDHPDPFGEDSSIWIARDQIAIFCPRSSFGRAYEFWLKKSELGTKRKRIDWTRLGSGHLGFQTLIQQLGEVTAPAPSKKRNGILFDPLEIRY